MDKQKAIDGYTMVEMMIVLMVLMMLLSISLLFMPKRVQLRFFMSELRDKYVMTQLQAIQKHDTLLFQIDDEVIYGDKTMAIPPGIVCDNQSFTIYPSGNVNHAGTIRCYHDRYQAELKIQLGSGHALLP